MLRLIQKKAWYKKASVVTALVAIFGISSILYTSNTFLNDYLVSAVMQKNPFSEAELKIYPWKDSNEQIIPEYSEIVSSFVEIRDRISEIDDKILANIRSGINEPSLFEEKADLLMEIGQYESAIAYYKETYDLLFEPRVLNKILQAENILEKIEMISK